jgi:hypothetical protein
MEFRLSGLHSQFWNGMQCSLPEHLRPEKFILYTIETVKDLMINYRLIPDDEGDLWTYILFWNPNFTRIQHPQH